MAQLLIYIFCISTLGTEKEIVYLLYFIPKNLKALSQYISKPNLRIKHYAGKRQKIILNIILEKSLFGFNFLNSLNYLIVILNCLVNIKAW